VSNLRAHAADQLVAHASRWAAVMPVQGAEVVAENLTAFEQGFLRHVNTLMRSIATDLRARVDANSGLTDHTLQALAVLDHPYARRHGEQGLPIHQPMYLVHRQSGALARATFHGTAEATVSGGTLSASAHAGVAEDRAPHAAYVVFGTSRMIPRDFLTASLTEVEPSAKERLTTQLRDLAFSFQPRGVTRG
jgi:hypothetical protein